MTRIADCIKTARRARNLTQAQMAEYLSVSDSAVSQWESGRNLPDLTLIPSICNLLAISADELLGVDLARHDERIKTIIENADNHASRGYNAEARAILEAGLREFPDSYTLMECMLWICGAGRDNDHETVIRYAEAILDGCTDEGIRRSAIKSLCYSYPECGQRERAIELVKSMPDIRHSREMMMPRVTTGDEQSNYERHGLERLWSTFETCLLYYGGKHDDGSPIYTADESRAIRDKLIAIFAILFEDGDCHFYHTHLREAHTYNARSCAKEQDADRTLHHLRAAAEHAIAFIDWTKQPHPTQYTSLLFRGEDITTWSTTATDNDAAQQIKELAHKRYDFIRDRAEFAAIRAMLEPHAGQWQVETK